jgi:hypothetical protein
MDLRSVAECGLVNSPDPLVGLFITFAAAAALLGIFIAMRLRQT